MADYGDLEWIPQGYDIGFDLLLVRDVAPEAVLGRLGVPAREQVPLTTTESMRQGEPPRIWGIRAGATADNWTYVMGQGGACATEHYVRAASRGTEAVGVSNNINAMTWFTHAHDGRILSSFEPGMHNALEAGHARQITADMRAVLTSGNTNRLSLALVMLRDAFGVRIRRQDADGPLPGGFISWK